MAAFEVLEVSISPQSSAGLLDVEFDRPKPGESADRSALHVAGWVLGHDDRPESIEITSGGRLVASVAVKGFAVSVGRRSPALLERHPGLPDDLRCGFVTLVGVLGLPPEFELLLRARFADGRDVPLATIKARHEPLRPPFEPTVQPLLVTASPRSGTTWLMKLLGGHPDVVVYDDYPYEHWPARYWTHALKVLTDPADTVNSSKPYGFDGNQFQVGHNPFFTPRWIQHPEIRDWLGRSHVERTAAFFLETIEDWYLTLARVQGMGRPRYFAEKNMFRHEVSPVLMRELYPRAREVFVVRDFRDLACSQLSYTSSRGQLDKSREEYVGRDMHGLAMDFRAAWRARSDRAYLLRYEDLILNPEQALPDLLAFLELAGDAGTVQAMMDTELSAKRHMTSPNARQSIGRWQKEDPAFQALLNETFEELLSEFGYEVSIPTAR